MVSVVAEGVSETDWSALVDSHTIRYGLPDLTWLDLNDIPSNLLLGSAHAKRVGENLSWFYGGRVERVQTMALEENLLRVHAYLASGDSLDYWRFVSRGSFQGFSVYVHELVELGGYIRSEIDPWSRTTSRNDFHAEALLVEHRLIQGTASAMGLHVPTLRDLIVYNPTVIGGDPDFDWECLQTHCSGMLSPLDCRSDTVDSACRVYEHLDFKPLEPD